MATGSTINNPIEYYPVGGNLTQDVNSWIRKDAASGSTTYYGYVLNLGANPAGAVWRIRREVVSGNVTIVTYANNGLYTSIWNNRASLTYK